MVSVLGKAQDIRWWVECQLIFIYGKFQRYPILSPHEKKSSSKSFFLNRSNDTEGFPWWLSCKDVGGIPELGRPPGEGNSNHSSILAWEIPWTEKPGGLQSMGLQREADTAQWLDNNGDLWQIQIWHLPKIWYNIKNCQIVFNMLQIYW